MNTNIQKTKKHLTIMFSIIVFVIVLVLWTIFFSAKYFKEVSIEKNEFTSLINDFENWRITINQIMNFWSKFDKNLIINRRLKKDDWTKFIQDFRERWFINYILINNESTIIASNVKDNINENFVLKINEDSDFFKIKHYEWFFIKKILLNNNEGTFIIIKEIRYSFLNYISDMFWFLLINLLFSLILYLIGFKFVNKAFFPVEENMKDMKDFIHNAWHELKTPISVIDSNIQLIDDMKSYDADMTNELKKEVLRLNSIIEWLIKLSNIDVFHDSIENNLNDVVDEIINEFKFQISKKEIKVNISIDKNILIKSNKDYFYIFISNIIANAIKYNNNKWIIDISFKNWKLIIKDSWIWINKKDLDKIFDRFFKADKSRNSEWFWIWLSLVKKIANIYNWNISVESNNSKWTKFSIKF